jgi:hypothetical protein
MICCPVCNHAQESQRRVVRHSDSLRRQRPLHVALQPFHTPDKSEKKLVEEMERLFKYYRITPPWTTCRDTFAQVRRHVVCFRVYGVGLGAAVFISRVRTLRSASRAMS